MELFRRMDQLRTAMQSSVSSNIDTEGATAQINYIRSQISSVGSVIDIAIDTSDIMTRISSIQQQIRNGLSAAAVDVVLNMSQALRQATALNGMLRSRIGTISTMINLTLPIASTIGAQICNKW